MSTVATPVTHPVRLTERINRIEPSSTMAAAAEAEKLRQQGIDIVDVTAGEPHFPTPQHVKDAAIAAINANFSKRSEERRVGKECRSRWSPYH